jgi:hypothetical protein
MLATSELQALIYSTLTGNSALSNLVGGRIYDQVPDNKVFPYVTIGESFPGPHHTHSRKGEETLQRIHAWSRAKGFKEGQLIAEAIRPLLDGQHFETDGFTVAGLWEGPGQAIRDPDGLTRHIVIDFRFWALQKAA